MICAVIRTLNICGIEKQWDFQEAERYMNKISVMLHVWILAHLEIQQMKLSSSNFAGRGITAVLGALFPFWLYFIIPANLTFLLFFFFQLQTCCSPACILTGNTWATVVYKKVFISLASSQNLICCVYFEACINRHPRQARGATKRQECAVDAPWKCCYVMQWGPGLDIGIRSQPWTHPCLSQQVWTKLLTPKATSVLL